MEHSDYVKGKYLHVAPSGAAPLAGNAATAKFNLVRRITLAFNIAMSAALIAFAISMLM